MDWQAWARTHRHELAWIAGAPFFLYAFLALAQLGDDDPSCGWQFPKWFACALSAYDALAGALIGAIAIVFAAWLAWRAVQRQINADRERMLEHRREAENLLQEELTELAEGLVAAWRILVAVNEMEDTNPDKARAQRAAREATAYMASRLSRPDALEDYRSMIELFAWDRQRVRCAKLVARLEEFRPFSDREGNWSLDDALYLVRDIADWFEMCLPYDVTDRLYDGLWRRSPKAMTFGMMVEHIGGLNY